MREGSTCGSLVLEATLSLPVALKLTGLPTEKIKVILSMGLPNRGETPSCYNGFNGPSASYDFIHRVSSFPIDVGG